MAKQKKSKRAQSAVTHVTAVSKTSKPRHDRVVLSWEAPEYIQQHKGPRWYIGAGIVLAVTVAIALLTDNWTLALAALAFAGVYQYTHTHHPPKMTEVRITEMGIYVGEMFFPYSHIQAFWIIYANGTKTLNLRVIGRMFSDVIIQMNHQNPVEVRQYLVGQIPEWEGKNERLGDILLRLLKL
ncbi:MAG TPA: hypothetical protein VI588_00215 [Candidatus Gracilibacteria bacterium]|nr:hypothetical protein [Candidatus Gracilibacteria bacterium]